MPRHCAVVLAVVVSCLLPAPGAAQDDLRTRIEQELFTFGDCGAPLCLDVDNVHGNHFLPGVSEGNAAVIAFVTDAVGRATASVPLGATSSGATFTFVGGLPVRTSTSAGPVFSERAQTLGRNRFFLGISVTGIEFSSLNGVPLAGLRLNVAHEDGEPVGTFGDPFFENDVIMLDLAMDVSVLVGTVALTYGLADFIDLGVAVPLVRTSVRGVNQAQILPFDESAPHHFGGDPDDPILSAIASMDGSASGLGDVVGRVKVNLAQGSRIGAALLAEGRFPTGDEENLLGSGSTEIRGLGILSAQFGSFAPHLNAGYAVRSDETRNDAVLASLGFDNLLTDWATLAAGVLTEWQVGAAEFELPPDIVWHTPFERRLEATSIPEKRNNIINATVGTKFTVRGGTVLTTNVMFPLREVGLQPDVYWTLGLDFSF